MQPTEQLKYNPDEAYRKLMAEKKPYICDRCFSTVMRTNQAERKRPWKGVCSACLASDRIKLNTFTNQGHPANWKGSKFLTGRLIGNWQRSAEKRGYNWLLTNDQLDNIWETQHGLCALTAIPLQLKGEFIVSPDRIDNSNGYIEGNVRFVVAPVNYLRRSLSDEKLLDYCRRIIQTKEGTHD